MVTNGAENGSIQDSTSMKAEIDRLVNSQIQSDEVEKPCFYFAYFESF